MTLFTSYTYLAQSKKKNKQEILSTGIILPFLDKIKLLLIILQSFTLSHTLLSCLIAVCIVAVPKDSDKEHGPFVKPVHDGSVILLGVDTPLLIITS